MRDHLKKYAPSVAGFLLGTAVNVSDIRSNLLAVVLAGGALLLLAWPVWDRLLEAISARNWGRRYAVLSGEPLVALLVGSALLTAMLAMAPVPPSTTSFGWLIIFVAVSAMFGAAWLGAAWLLGALTAATPTAVAGQQSVPLLEAATRAYEATRGTLVATFAEAPIGRKDRREGTLTWFCWQLWERLTLYGNWPPSRIPEKIDWEKKWRTHGFEMQNGILVLKARDNNGYFENLYVLASELPKALQEIKALSPEPMPEPQAGLPLYDAIDRIKARVDHHVDVERLLRDALSLGRLDSWARAIRTGDGETALEPIPPETWRDRTFVVVRPPGKRPFTWIAWSDARGRPYTHSDVRLSGIQIDGLWPEPMKDDPRNEDSLRRRRIREGLANLIEEADPILADLRDIDSRPPTAAIGEWNKRVEAFLVENLDASYVALFRDGSGVVLDESKRIVMPPHRNLEAGVLTRLARLREFIRELKCDDSSMVANQRAAVK